MIAGLRDIDQDLGGQDTMDKYISRLPPFARSSRSSLHSLQRTAERYTHVTCGCCAVYVLLLVLERYTHTTCSCCSVYVLLLVLEIYTHTTCSCCAVDVLLLVLERFTHTHGLRKTPWDEDIMRDLKPSYVLLERYITWGQGIYVREVSTESELYMLERYHQRIWGV